MDVPRDHHSDILNSGAAYTDGFTVEIGIGQDQYNTGNTLMSVGIVLLEVGSTQYARTRGHHIDEYTCSSRAT